MSLTLPPLDPGTRMPYAVWRIAARVNGQRSAADIAAELGVEEERVRAVVQGIKAAINGQRPASAVELQAVRAALSDAVGPMGALFLEDAFDELGSEHPPLTRLTALLTEFIDDPSGRARFAHLLSSKGIS